MTKNLSKPGTWVSVMGLEGLVRVWLSRPMGYNAIAGGSRELHGFTGS
jgi:hypothetical protein